MIKYKAAFFDIDGTLVSFETHSVPESTKLALKILKENGVKVFVSSGRHMWAINNLGDLKFDGYVTINGGITIVGEQIISKNPISRSGIKSFNNYLETIHNFPCIFVLENQLVLNYYDEKVYALFDLLNFPKVPTADLRTFEESDIFQIIAFFDKDEEPAILKIVQGCDSARWHPMFADVVPRGQSKVDGMKVICNYFGIDQSETIAFGDGGNDIEMLRWAGVGVAMGNAESQVMQIADIVTDSVDNDGIYNFVKKIFD